MDDQLVDTNLTEIEQWHAAAPRLLNFILLRGCDTTRDYQRVRYATDPEYRERMRENAKKRRATDPTFRRRTNEQARDNRRKRPERDRDYRQGHPEQTAANSRKQGGKRRARKTNAPVVE